MLSYKYRMHAIMKARTDDIRLYLDCGENGLSVSGQVPKQCRARAAVEEHVGDVHRLRACEINYEVHYWYMGTMHDMDIATAALHLTLGSSRMMPRKAMRWLRPYVRRFSNIKANQKAAATNTEMKDQHQWGWKPCNASFSGPPAITNADPGFLRTQITRSVGEGALLLREETWRIWEHEMHEEDFDSPREANWDELRLILTRCFL